MNLEKVVFAFVVILAATLNLGFVYGGISDPGHHPLWQLFAATVVSLIAAVLKLGDRSHMGALQLASSLVVLLQLIVASLVWFFAGQTATGLPSTSALVTIVSLSAGALFANVTSVIIMLIDTTAQRR
jgi:hypothetical protein